MRTNTTFLWLAACLVVAQSRALADYVTLTGRTFGTSYLIKVIDEGEVPAEAIKTNVERTLSEIDQLMSTYRDDSEVSAFNGAGAGEWFEVSEQTARVVQRSLEISQQTNGAFDITVGPAVALWKFGAARKGADFQVPSDTAVSETLEKIGYQKLAVRMDPPALKKTVGDLQIDLSAIAKGYAVDAVAATLDSYPSFMVEIGGEVRTKGSRQLGAGWRIGLETPIPDQRQVDSVVVLHDEAMATSGDYRNFFVHDGVTYSHTIDPQTAAPAKHRLASVTVLAEDCATADALATALLVMGPEKASAFAEKQGIRARFTVREQADTLSQTTTAGFVTEGNSKAAESYWGMLIFTAIAFGLAVLAMSLGTILANRRLQGSCGGMAGLKDKTGNTVCDMCSTPSPECAGEPA